MQDDEKRWQETGQQDSDYGRQEGQLGGDTEVTGEGELGGTLGGQAITGTGEEELGQPEATGDDDEESSGATGPSY